MDKVSMIGRLRRARGETQRAVALALDVTERTYVRWEVGPTLPDAVNLIKLADHFGVEPRVLVPESATAQEGR